MHGVSSSEDRVLHPRGVEGCEIFGQVDGPSRVIAAPREVRPMSVRHLWLAGTYSILWAVPTESGGGVIEISNTNLKRVTHSLV